jgi:hypothetical protein
MERLDAIFNPAAVAVVGASNTPGKVGLSTPGAGAIPWPTAASSSTRRPALAECFRPAQTEAAGSCKGL